MGRIGVMSALHEELSSVLSEMPDEQRVRVAGRDFWVGHLGGHEVVAVLSRIGKVSAATTATLLATRFGVDAIVFTGVAGGLAPHVRRGDIVVAREFLQHDLDVWPLFPHHEVPLYGKARFPTDSAWTARLVDAAERCAMDLPTVAGQDLFRKHGLTTVSVWPGLILSGDRFIASPQEAKQLLDTHADALAVEMEGAAVAQVCDDFHIPFAAIRVVSDRADATAATDFASFVGDLGAIYSRLMVLCALERRA